MILFDHHEDLDLWKSTVGMVQEVIQIVVPISHNHESVVCVFKLNSGSHV